MESSAIFLMSTRKTIFLCRLEKQFFLFRMKKRFVVFFVSQQWSSQKRGTTVPAALGTFGAARHILGLEVGNRFFSEKYSSRHEKNCTRLHVKQTIVTTLPQSA